MFLLGDDRLVISASDLRTASVCEFALVRELDVALGRASALATADDAMAERVIQLGNEHEQAELRRLVSAHRGRVVQFERPTYTRAGLEAAHAQTVAALTGDAEVVYQATFFDGGFVGHADFLERTPEGWLVSDTKLARRESVPALLQIAAYAAMLRDSGVPAASVARLVVGSGDIRDFALDDILPVYLARRRRLDTLLAEHHGAAAAAVWGDPRWLACGRCEVCEPEVEAARDLLLVAGVRAPTRRRLREAGVLTIDDLAVRTEPVPDVRASTLERIRQQARLQLEQEADPGGGVRYEVTDADPLRRMPPPSPGDVFFDFEGDPLWSEPGSATWGLEYLFGCLTVDRAGSGSAGAEPAGPLGHEGVVPGPDGTEFTPFWAHDRAEERRALVAFIGWLTERRRRWPDLHVYHYAAYETAALLRLAARHGVCEDEVDQLLRDGVFVDLYGVVRSAVRVSQRSYSIKKLEPLYMGAREAAVTNAADSIVVYHQVIAATIAGREEEQGALLREIRDYNLDDCVSTWLLRDWLLDRGAEHRPGEGAVTPVTELAEPQTPSDQRLGLMRLEALLRDRLDGVRPHERTPEQQAVALVASSVLFHAREDKPVWQAHFERLRTPVRDWRSADGVFVIDGGEVVTGWHKPPGARSSRRVVRVDGEPLRSIPLGPGSEVSTVYSDPAPDGITTLPGHCNACSTSGVRVLEALDTVGPNGRLHQVLLVEELLPRGCCEHDVLPVALVPSRVLSTRPIDDALAEVAQAVVDADGLLPHTAGIDLLLRRPPRQVGGGSLPAVGPGPTRHVDAVTDALLSSDSSYLAVQGPPGTGKTYVASHVIARLVLEHGWRVGVTSQGHKAIENVLRAVVAAGVPAAQVGKATRDPEGATWTVLGKADDLRGFTGPLAAAGLGYVVGGTAWDLTSAKRIGRGELDLVVADEAGQFSLAKTLACSVAGSRLLLLGDPQQLPQVSQGTHPDPVDASALGWLIGDEAVLPADLGYFLETTWRMHPALTEVVSRLSYAGRLRSEERVTAARSLDGVDPGLHVRLVDHHDNSTWSPEEADAVLGLVLDLLGRTWHDPSEKGGDGLHVGSRPLGPADILVITPYNGQVGRIRRTLDDAGLADVAVGTVDKFQGQEAPVAILSMAASSHSDVSRGMGFLLDRHRLNVAVSRGKHAAFVVRSEVLTDFAPRTTDELLALGAFLGLCEQAVTTERVEPLAVATV
ncbi:TM0106 family RecB-like putative nuclease [Oryzobacter sp. R7]|uniref:TM0106 family RecB-like putative nuclease n=1 Tax=Oryzobacter faecalis TaxID=3388656 RepID=UPI00398CB034